MTVSLDCRRWTVAARLMVLVSTALGCADASQLLNPSWQAKNGWKAEDYFPMQYNVVSVRIRSFPPLIAGLA
jgi:hypothetical protein